MYTCEIEEISNDIHVHTGELQYCRLAKQQQKKEEEEEETDRGIPFMAFSVDIEIWRLL